MERERVAVTHPIRWREDGERRDKGGEKIARKCVCGERERERECACMKSERVCVCVERERERERAE